MTRLRSIFYFVRMVVFYIGFALTTLFFGSVMTLLTCFLPYRVRFSCIVSGWCYSMLGLMRVICGVRYRIIGGENLKHPSTIVMSKHSSRFETIALPAIIPSPTLVLKKELLNFPLIGWSLKCCEVIAIDRSTGSQALKDLTTQGKVALEKGRQIIMFPEGTRKGGEYKKGGMILARSTKSHIIPIAHNAHECWPNRQFYLTPGLVTFVVGEPIDVAGKTTNQLLEEVKQWIETQVEAISMLNIN